MPEKHIRNHYPKPIQIILYTLIVSNKAKKDDRLIAKKTNLKEKISFLKFRVLVIAITLIDRLSGLGVKTIIETTYFNTYLSLSITWNCTIFPFYTGLYFGIGLADNIFLNFELLKTGIILRVQGVYLRCPPIRSGVMELVD